ncbi:MAG: SUMF1/EgtB/PvdO family nonheme iron enzyme [Terriglobia bacterium]
MRTCPKCQRTYGDHIDSCPQDATALVSAASATQVELESTLGRKFRLVRRLGAGGMGTVFLAEQIAVGNRPVALKILLRKLIDDPEFLLRFQNEAASTGRIHHANVVTIYESGQADDGSPYIAMEYLDGESLRQALERRGSLPVAECVDILQQAARGLNAAHKLGIIHRDLKPDNIFLTRSDDDVGAIHESPLPANVLVKIVDFGIAKLRESATHTLTGTVLGTPAYMSFEQASGMKSEELDARSDVYSLGIVAYEMLTGRVPFHSDTPLGCVRKHLSEEPPPFRAVKPELAASPELEKVVMKALAKDRDARFASVVEFGRQFANAAHAPQPAASDAPLPSTKIVSPSVGAVHEPPPTSPAQSRRILAIFLGAVAFITVVAATVYWRGLPSGGLLQPEAPVTETSSSSSKEAVARAPSPGTVRLNPKDGLKYVWIPRGTFMMGCSPRDRKCDAAEKPAHQVTITKGFWMGQTEVTVGAYKRFARSAGKAIPPEPNFMGRALNSGWNKDAMPIVDVTWDEARDYCSWAGGRLPTEAEWEYAARGGNTDARYRPLDEVAWYADNSGQQRLDSAQISEDDPKNYAQRLKDNGNGMHEVAQKRPNGFGLFDTLGNVWEWVNDWYDANYYQNSPSQDPTGSPSGTARVLRGGSWLDYPMSVRVSYRVWYIPGNRNYRLGFRCAREVDKP